MNPRSARTAAALLLEAVAIVLLLLVVLGRPWPSERKAVSVYVLADRSTSVASTANDEVVAATVSTALRTHVPTEVRVVEFAGLAATPRRVAIGTTRERSPSDGALEPQATNIEAALEQAVGSLPPGTPAAAVVVSDGNATDGDTARALRSAADAGVPVLWRALVPVNDRPRIVEVLAPPTARPGQDVPVTIRLAGELTRPATLRLSARDGAADAASARIAAGLPGEVAMQLRTSAPGTLVLDVELDDAERGAALDHWPDAAAIDVEPPAEILYVAAAPRPYARSLDEGGWRIEGTTPAGLDAKAGNLGHYAAVVLDDVPASAARPETWGALAAAVREQGTGLLVLGGELSFGAGSYRDSKLEAVLPVVSRPGALGDAAAVVFVVDKSGSMGASAAGVDRFRLAQRAVIETAATLTDRDSAGLVAFDVGARDLLPLQDAAAFRQAVARPWPVQPRGGTRLGPALDAALKQLDAATAPRRLVVLVTDGFVNESANRALQERLARGKVELVALAVGPDADVAALTALFPANRSTILRVGEAAELPAMMRQGLETRRAPIERGRIAVQERRPLPFARDAGPTWPTVAAYDVTMPAPDAVVYLESERGDPLVAFRQAGIGRVVAVTPGLGAWTPEWLRWRRWPELAGGLVEWVASANVEDGRAASVEDLPRSLRLDVDATSGGKWSEETGGRVRVQYPSGRVEDMALVPSAPGRASAEIEDAGTGLYAFTVETAGAATSLVHLRRAPRELGATAPNPDIADWRRAGLVRDWSPAAFEKALGELRPAERHPSRAVLLALALFLLGVLVDRARGK